jgi:hypothetical protein
MDPLSFPRHAQICVANSRMMAQMKLLDMLLMMCTSKPPLYVCEVLKWDEAKVRVSLPMLRAELDTSRATESSAWHTLMSKRLLMISWPGTAILEFNLISVPVPVMDTSASAVFDGLFSVHMAIR